MKKRDEKDLSAKQSTAKTDSRISRPDGHTGGAANSETAPRQRSSPFDSKYSCKATSLSPRANAFRPEQRLRRRSDFIRVRQSGQRLQTRHFVVYLAMLPDQTTPRLGMAVSRNIGNAVVRNTIRRRLRESFRLCLNKELALNCDLFIIARHDAGKLGTWAMVEELQPGVFELLKRSQAQQR